MRNIPFSPPDISEEEIEEVVDTLRSGWITTGPKTKLFEKKIAEYCGNQYSAALNSATACMEMTLRALGVGPGDEVITSAYTYTATASVIHHVGAKIVLVDIQEDSLEMDYRKLSEAITEKTKVIIPVDIAGIMCDYDEIYNIVNDKKKLFIPGNDIQKVFNRIIVMADAAHSFGATYKGERSGAVADFTAFSFHAVKNLTTAEGGAVTWKEIKEVDSKELYQTYMNLSLHGQTKDALAKTQVGSWEYDIVAPNFKCNMTDIQASIGLVQLSRYNDLLIKRREVIDAYDISLVNENVSSLEHYSNKGQSSGHLYILEIEGFNEEKRNELINKLAENGISSNVHYKPLPLLTAYKNLGFDIKNYPNAYNFYSKTLTLPLHTKLSDEDINYITESLNNYLGELL